MNEGELYSQKEGKKIESIVELVDLFPTICNICNIPEPDGLNGKALSLKNKTNSKNSEGFSKYHKGWSITTNNYSYTQWINSKTSEQIGEMFYDLVNDPKENINISEKKKNKIARKKKKIQKVMKLKMKLKMKKKRTWMKTLKKKKILKKKSLVL